MKGKKDPCRKAIEKMYLILEQEGAGSLCENIKAHLEGCEACARRYETLEDLVSLCQEFRAEEFPEDQKQKMKEDLLKRL